MFTRARAYARSWKFLFQDIPPAPFRLFLISYLGFCAFTLLILAENGTANPIDQAIANWAHRHPALRAEWSQQITRLGGGGFVDKGCWAGVAILLLLRKWKYVPVLFIGAMGEMIANKWVQNNLGRPRPSFGDIAPINAYSFPSGHTGAAAAFLGFWIIFLLIEYPKRMLAKILISVLAVALALASLSRIFLLAHWTTDVLAGLCFALAWLLLCFWINERMQPFGQLDSPPKHT